MKITKNALFFLILVATISSCGKHQPSVAERRAARRAQDSVELIQHERTIRYTDSLLQVLLPQIDPLLKDFRYEKNEQYEDHGHYVHRLLTTTSNDRRCFLQAYVSDNRETTIRSYYYGLRPIHHKSIVLSADSVEHRFEGSNHTFEAEGYHETLSLSGNDALDVLRFLSGFAESRIRVQLFGDSDKPAATYYISSRDLSALLSTFQLGIMMSDIHQLELQQRQSSLQVEKYQKRLKK